MRGSMTRRDGTGGLGAAAERSLTLLRVFLLASAVILLGGGIVLGSALARSLRTQAIDDRRQALQEYVDGVLRPHVVHDDRLVVGPAAGRLLVDEVRRNRDLIIVKVWRPDGVLAWTNRGADRIGMRFELEGHLGEAITGNEATGELDELNDEEDVLESKLGFKHVLEVYAPVPSADGSHAIGAYEIYAQSQSRRGRVLHRGEAEPGRLRARAPRRGRDVSARGRLTRGAPGTQGRTSLCPGRRVTPARWLRSWIR